MTCESGIAAIIIVIRRYENIRPYVLYRLNADYANAAAIGRLIDSDYVYCVISVLVS
jgi:hypothetical protein